MSNPSIFFIPVSDNGMKLHVITDLISTQFSAGKTVLIATPNMQVAQYVDALLWKLPEESFLPHSIKDSVSTERIVITTQSVNWNKATILLNLCPGVSPIYQEFECIYELWDETDPSKTELSANRKATYGI